tara:strand:+ start:140 stop:340 length:201 start_codon:yes stop_codon:yes gene_type:complete
MIEQTPQDTYNAAMDSVNLINAGNVSNMPEDEWADTVARNKEHLVLMLTKDFWTTEDLTPLQEASE